MIRNYPAAHPSTAPATGRLFYEFLMGKIAIPASANHTIWYAGVEDQLKHPDKFAFRGDIPKGRTLELITLASKPINAAYTFKGDEEYVLVSDLSEFARKELGIPADARGRDKVFNSNFKPFNQLSEFTRWSNELAALSVPKSISSYLAGVKGKVNYSEQDVLNLLETGFRDLSSPEMMHFLHGNHLAWAALAYMREKGNVAGDLLTEFHSQNTADFYTKDLGTVLPAMFFALANLGQDPMKFHDMLDIEVYGTKGAAEYMRQFMPKQ